MPIAQVFPLPTGRKASRVWIENIRPQVDCGRFPIKRVVGEKVAVSAFVFADGHDEVKAVLSFRHGDGEWQETAISPHGYDLWKAAFQVEQIGTYQYTVKGWIDHFSTWQNDLNKKFSAGQKVASELLEGAVMVDAAAGRADTPDRQWLSALAAMLRGSDPPADLVARATASEVGAMMNRYSDRAREAVFEPFLAVIVEPELAACSAWYEIFPRSLSTAPDRSGTFNATIHCELLTDNQQL